MAENIASQPGAARFSEDKDSVRQNENSSYFLLRLVWVPSLGVSRPVYTTHQTMVDILHLCVMQY
jgi:hypothetical protein